MSDKKEQSKTLLYRDDIHVYIKTLCNLQKKNLLISEFKQVHSTMDLK